MSTDGHAVKRLTPDEIQDQIHQLARDGDSAGQRWALRLLSSETSGAALPEPLTLGEMEDRGARVLRGMGMEMAKRCFYTAFREAAKLTYVPNMTTSDVIQKWSHVHFPTTLRKLNKMFPEFKRAGRPRGYPMSGSEAARREWIVKETCKRLEEREQRDNEKVAHLAANPSKSGMDAGSTEIAPA